MVGKKKSVRYFFLAGGLGNQLFQFAAALEFAKGSKIELQSLLNNCRLNSSGEPELTSFKLPENVTVSKKRYGKITVRIVSALISIGLTDNKSVFRNFLKRLVSLLAKVILSTVQKQFVIPVAINGVGFDEKYHDTKNLMPIGYMQSHRWIKDITTREVLMNLAPKVEDERILKYKHLAELESPTIVHFRFGDYVGNESFGRPDPSYYLSGLNFISKRPEKLNIWVFSDDISRAKEEFPQAYKSRVRWIDDLNDSVVATFEVMRLGSAYVIANSTFSWWAAYLNRNGATKVCVPIPWFRNMNDPIDMSPAHWSAIAVNYPL